MTQKGKGKSKTHNSKQFLFPPTVPLGQLGHVYIYFTHIRWEDTPLTILQVEKWLRK